jgi:hypothetical protein
MKFFSNIVSKIFGATHPIATALAGGEKPKGPIENADVEAILAKKAFDHSEKLDWKKSIVDLLKLLDIDSSLKARKELARELGYPEKDMDAKGSAEMNIWLHKQVIKKLAENGGKVPQELLD